jgi:chitin synthase
MAWVPYVANATALVYVLTVLVCVGGSLMGVVWTKHAWKASLIFSFFTFLMLGLVIWNVIGVYIGTANLTFAKVLHDFESMCVFVMTCLNVGCYIFIVFIHLFTHPTFVFRIIVDAMSYLAYQGAYSHVMVIYSFCNIDDVSWGTKGVKSVGQKKYSVEKVFFVANW